MTCERVALPGGTAAIVCGVRPRRRCACGQPATLLCDWKMGAGKTCDADLCAGCAFTPAADKHLCREHTVAFAQWQAGREAVRA